MIRESAFRVIAWVLLVAAGASAQEPADLVIHNGTIFTADDLLSVHSAMAVRDGRVVGLGGEELLERYAPPEILDLGGRFVVPGFNATHTHINGRPDWYVHMAGVESIGEFQERLVAKAEELRPGEWIIGWGWSEDEMAERRLRTREDLDAVIPDNPAAIARAGGHSAVLNSLALELGGVDRDTPNPPGGMIERDESGEPTGIIRENWGMVGELIPRPSYEELRASLVENLKSQFSFGITSFIEAMTRPGLLEMWRDVYAEHGDALPRAAIQIHFPVGFGEGDSAATRLQDLDLLTGQGDERLRIGALKLFVDGGYTGPAAWTLEHYRDQPDYFGHARLHPHDFFVGAKTAHELGWQLGVHTIGDAAIKMAVDQFVRILDESPRVDHRHFLTHFTVMPPDETMRAMADYNIHIAQQPNFTWNLEGRYSRHLVGERLQTNNPLRTPMAHGIFGALGTDIIPTGPLRGIHSAVTRRGMTGAVYGEEQAITVPKAIVGYTRNGAYLTFEADLKGTLEPGRYADFVVLSRDLRRIDPDTIDDVEVLMTFLEGRLMYEAPSAGANGLDLVGAR